jgi:hypothetical protein
MRNQSAAGSIGATTVAIPQRNVAESVTHDPHPIAFIAEATFDEVASGGTQFVGHIDELAPPRLIEEGPGWETVEAAIA